MLADAGAASPFLGYQPSFAMSPFPAVICTSDQRRGPARHPIGYRLADGDLVSIDCGATLDGWTGDAAISFTVGTPRPRTDERLIKVGYEALAAGIGAAVAGQPDRRHLGGDRGGRAGRAASESPPTTAATASATTCTSRRRCPTRAGPDGDCGWCPASSIAIEPWFMGGGDDRYRIDPDGWTIRSVDGSRCVHVENTVAITEDGPVVLTAL